MKIRKANTKDVPSIVKMIADDALGATREAYKTPLPAFYYKAFENISSDKNQHLVVIENDTEEVIGTMQLSFIQYLTYKGGIRAQIEAVRVRSDYRGQKIGEKLFLWAIEKSKNEGAHLLQLTTDKTRKDAMRFYENLGFVASHEGMKLHFK